MKQIRVLVVTFGIQIQPYEVPAFRGALAEHVGYEHEWFHNHNNLDKDRPLHYRYPLIQYKINSRNQPVMVFLEQGVDEAYKFFSKSSLELTIKNVSRKLTIAKMEEKVVTLQTTDEMYDYKLYRWLALNQRNIREWDKKKSTEERHQFLERIIASTTLSFGKGVGWNLEKRIEPKIIKITRKKTIRFKSINTLAFDVRFQINAVLPEWVGLGKGVSRGFGILRRG